MMMTMTMTMTVAATVAVWLMCWNREQSNGRHYRWQSRWCAGRHLGRLDSQWNWPKSRWCAGWLGDVVCSQMAGDVGGSLVDVPEDAAGGRTASTVSGSPNNATEASEDIIPLLLLVRSTCTDVSGRCLLILSPVTWSPETQPKNCLPYSSHRLEAIMVECTIRPVNRSAWRYMAARIRFKTPINILSNIYYLQCQTKNRQVKGRGNVRCRRITYSFLERKTILYCAVLEE